MNPEQTPIGPNSNQRADFVRRQAASQTRPVASQPQVKGVSLLNSLWARLAIAVVILIIGFLAYGYISTRNQLAKLTDSKTSEQAQASMLVKEISKFMVLPDETPTLATVNDVSKLKDQQFFRNAQNGDKVLIFSKSGRALLYRISTHKVIEYALVNLNASTQ